MRSRMSPSTSGTTMVKVHICCETLEGGEGGRREKRVFSFPETKHPGAVAAFLVPVLLKPVHDCVQ